MFEGQFWVRANDNFMDLCVLEWCKLFADLRGKHHWQRVTTNRKAFFDGLLEHLRIAETEFDTHKQRIRHYRDKFVAHLDSDEVMHIPTLAVARKSVIYLYEYLLAHEDEGNFLPDAPPKASTYYAQCLEQGKAAYERNFSSGSQLPHES